MRSKPLRSQSTTKMGSSFKQTPSTLKKGKKGKGYKATKGVK